MIVEQVPGAGEDPVGQDMFVDLLGDCVHLGLGVTFDEPQCSGADRVDVSLIFTEEEVGQGVPGEEGDVPAAEEAAPVELAGQVVGGGSADDGVVDVEECRSALTHRSTLTRCGAGRAVLVRCWFDAAACPGPTRRSAEGSAGRDSGSG